MRVQTKAYGEIDADPRQLVAFPEGLLGFEKFTEFVLLDARQKPFLYLQSVDVPDLAFILIDPFLFRADYSIDVADETLDAIGIEKPGDALVFAIVTVPPDGGGATANLMGPLIINKANRKGIQAVLTDLRWKVKHDIMAELAESRG
ncbi:MAG: flagellar assembly protein FliW, partial [Spirochaetaceae bacterium]|nr:flagellar assembly protein FliW [Spirochaetaceae bacterium]